MSGKAHMRLYKLNKTVLRFTNNAAQFLNGLTSNTLEAPRNAFLNIHGRIVATFDQIKINDDEFYLLVEPPFVEGLFAHLDRYVKLSSVKIEELNKKVYCDVETKKVFVSDDDLAADVSDEAFTLFRLTNGIPVQGIDYQDEFILNVDEQNFVSFTKGCFLGQEPVSKVHNRSRPSWDLSVRYEDECTEEEKQKMTSKAKEPQSGRVKGFVFVRNEKA